MRAAGEMRRRSAAGAAARASPAAGAVVELLKVLLKARAEDSGVASKLIATVSDLEQIANDDNAKTAALVGWRREAFGEDCGRDAILNRLIELQMEGSIG